MNALKLILLLIVFPLLLAATGGWEWQRAVDGALKLSEFEANLEIARPHLQGVMAQDPTASMEVNGEKLSVQLVLSRLDKAVEEIGTARRVKNALQTLAKWVIGMGLLAALIGAAALCATHWAGAQARKSRQALLQVFSLGSRLLPYVLVGQAIALAATVALLLTYEGLGFWHIGRLSSGEVKVMTVAGVIAAFCLYTVWMLLRQLRWMLAMFKPTPLPMAPGERVGEHTRRIAAGPYCGEPDGRLLRDLQRRHRAAGRDRSARPNLASATAVPGGIQPGRNRRGNRP
jgi:hypothetical protein